VIPAKVLILGGSVVQSYPQKKGRGTEERKLLYLFLVKMMTIGLGSWPAERRFQLTAIQQTVATLHVAATATYGGVQGSRSDVAVRTVPNAKHRRRLHRQRRGDKLLGRLRGLFSAPSSPSMPIQFVASLCPSFASRRSLQIGARPDCNLPSFQCNNTFGASCLLA
jgi:hypothetical protein